jgi:RNA polymerase sigma-70 factor (ECF subfamily)
MNDASLIAAHRHGDPLAFGALIERHREALMGFLRRRVGDDAEELHQELWVRMSRNLDRYQGSERFRAILYTAARRLVIDHRRRRAARPSLVLVDGPKRERLTMETPGFATVGHDPIARSELVDAVEEALATLPPRMAEVVRLRLTEDLSFAEIAERQGAPLNTVLTRMHRGLKKLRAELVRRGVSPEIT